MIARTPVYPAVATGHRRELGYVVQLPFRRPMLDLNAAKAVTGLGENGVLDQIYAGNIRWAFNLNASGKVAGGHAFVMILARSLACFCKPVLAQPETVGEVAEILLPAETLKTGCVRGTELQFAFNVTSEHVLRLWRAGGLVAADESRPRRGPGGSMEFTRESVVRMLEQRRFL